MKIELPDRTIEVFTISPRTQDLTLYWKNIESVTRWSEKYDCTGILIFTGNDVYIEPWLVAHKAILETRNLCPLVAVNPVYMHPFTAAKMISSFAYLYKRKIFLNMVTGTALNYLDSLNDKLSHDDRYERLLEYIQIVKSLLAGPRMTDFIGKFYQVSNLQLLPRMDKRLFPGFLLAGQSGAARKICEAVGAVGMQMLKPELEQAVDGAGGIHFGIITRETEDEAWAVAHELMPEDEVGREILDYSMKNTDSVWKRQMKEASEESIEQSSNYWLAPFRNFKADCPYFVGDYNQVTDLLVRLIGRGIDLFILDIPAREEEFRHINIAFKKAGQQLLSRPGAGWKMVKPN
jgi:alkanesulfonate monooxygenase